MILSRQTGKALEQQVNAPISAHKEAKSFNSKWHETFKPQNLSPVTYFLQEGHIFYFFPNSHQLGTKSEVPLSQITIDTERNKV